MQACSLKATTRQLKEAQPNPTLDIGALPAFLRRLPCRGVAQLARAPVSKTGGWGFETLHPCHLGRDGARLAATRIWNTWRSIR